MFERFNDIVCVQAGWLYQEGGVMSKHNYDNLNKRNQIEVVRRGCYGTPALVRFDSIPYRFKSVIIEKYGDPQKKDKPNTFADRIERDVKAEEFFKAYTLANGSALPQKNIEEYITNSSILNTMHVVLSEAIAARRALRGKKGKVLEYVAEAIAKLPKHTFPHSLPANPRRLKEKYKAYCENSYSSLIHKGFCNDNSEKINEGAKVWVISRWADQISKCVNMAQLLFEYNLMAEKKGWKALKDEKTLHLFLNKETVKHLWWGHRYGDSASKEKFAYQHSTKLPTMRDSLWYSDGTKLNYFYLNDDGKISTCMVYEVMDAYSEVLLGYHISPTENYDAQYFAYKMAVQSAGHKPYQIGFDGQGGHKKLQAGNFLSKLARLCIKTAPYNGKSKTIESAFGRFQQQFLKRDGSFFTGQNITTKTLESKANMEFIMANKNNLPTLNEIKATYAKRRAEWNQAPHPKTGIPRIEMYRTSENPNTPKVNIWDMVDLFWIQREKPVTCTAYGISMKEKKHKYTYMVYTQDQLPDVEWLRNHIDKKFYIKFDPDNMDMVYLYEKDVLGLRFVCEARTKIEVARNIQEQDEFEAGLIKKVRKAVDDSRIAARDKVDGMLEEHGRLPEQKGYNSTKLLGVKGDKKRAKLKTEIGEVWKQVSLMVPVTDETVKDPTNLY